MAGLPVRPPVAPMLGRLARELPVDGFVYEPKWDGFRCLAFRCGHDVDLRSRHDRPFSRYFPELVEALSPLPALQAVLDGEILASTSGRFDFTALLGRLHPAASRVERLARETPARFLASWEVESAEDLAFLAGDVVRRLAQRPDPFAAMLEERQRLPSAR